MDENDKITAEELIDHNSDLLFKVGNMQEKKRQAAMFAMCGLLANSKNDHLDSLEIAELAREFGERLISEFDFGICESLNN